MLLAHIRARGERTVVLDNGSRSGVSNGALIDALPSHRDAEGLVIALD